MKRLLQVLDAVQYTSSLHRVANCGLDDLFQRDMEESDEHVVKSCVTEKYRVVKHTPFVVGRCRLSRLSMKGVLFFS
ncbi:hypothetical protein [Paenibacillus barengoltzii]|uniref:hypothetical protein n=1 Tax=Paenibacillus barengoltzii TaxID=343517 RepID=UPI001AD81DF2|nr:hypothetical protein [Paenibacillus barengoltzii]